MDLLSYLRTRKIDTVSKFPDCTCSPLIRDLTRLDESVLRNIFGYFLYERINIGEEVAKRRTNHVVEDPEFMLVTKDVKIRNKSFWD